MGGDQRVHVEPDAACRGPAVEFPAVVGRQADASFENPHSTGRRRGRGLAGGAARKTGRQGHDRERSPHPGQPNTLILFVFHH